MTTNDETNGEDQTATMDWTDWVIAYTSIQGATPMCVRSGYMGRMRDMAEGIMEDAVEFESVTAPAPGGQGISRSHRAMPVELNAEMGTVFLPESATIIPLKGLSTEALRTFAAARLECAEALASITPGKPEAPRIITPDGPPPLVGINGGFNGKPRR